MSQTTNLSTTDSIAQEKSIYKLASLGAWMQLAVTLVIIIVGFSLGPPPATMEEYFTIFQENRLSGILRDDFTSLVMIALYLLTFPGLYIALKRVNRPIATYATLLTFIGVTAAFATHSGFSLLYLSDQYAAATTEMQRTQLLAAGEAVIASNMWHSSGGYMAGILLQGSGILISVIMLRSKDFSKATAYAGLLGNGIDLLQHILHPFTPAISEILMMVMGPFYLAWFILLGRDFFKLGRDQSKN